MIKFIIALINILSLVGSFYVAIKLISVKGDNLKMFLEKPYLIKAVSLVLLIIAWVDNVSLAQVDFMVFFLILLSLLAYEKKRPFLSGIIIAAAGVIKIYPLYFLLYFLLKRRFKAVTGFIVGILLFALIVPWVVLGQDNFNGSMKSWVEMRAMPHLQSAGDDTRENYARCESQFKPSNQAFSAIIMRYFMQDSKDVVEWKTVDFKYKIYWPHPLTPKQVDTLIKVLLLLVLLISYAGLDYKRAYRDNIYLGLEYSVIFLSMLLFFPMVKSHTFAPMLFPLVVFNYLKTTRGEKQLYNSRWMEKTFWAAVVLYCLQAFRYMQVLGAGCLSIVLLWILFIGMLRKEKKLRLES